MTDFASKYAFAFEDSDEDDDILTNLPVKTKPETKTNQTIS